jgi:metal-responsive CopG/Arc/MetJ family transcriptional regulator
LDIDKSPEPRRQMGRPPLNMQATNIRFPKELLDRIDALVGDKHRAKFIREAVEARVRYAEELRELGGKKP